VATSDMAVRTLAEAFKNQSERIGDVFKLQADQLIQLIAEFRKVLAERGTTFEPAPPQPTPAPAPRNGSPELDDADSEDEADDSQEGEGEVDADDMEEASMPPREPDWLDRAQAFCAAVPPENLLVVGQLVSEHGPQLVADAVRKVIKEGVAGFVAKGSGTPGGGEP
jgi:hypothetical protein